MAEDRLNENKGWKAFLELRGQVQRSAAAGMSEAEVDAEIAAGRSCHEQKAE